MTHFFSYWGTVKEQLGVGPVMLFLDFDGTLAPIADTPQKAVLPKSTRTILERLSKNPRCTVCIISGRALKDIKKIVGIKKITYVGNHGLEAQGPGFAFVLPLKPGYRRIITGIKQRLQKKLRRIKGVFL